MSQPSSHTYETVYVLKSGLSDSDAAAIHQKVDNVINKFSGQLKTRDDWGLQQLAYPIENETMGKYAVVVYTGQSGVVEEIERHFKISADVVRYLTTSVEPDYDYAKVKKQVALSEEEMKKAREMRKKGQ